MRSLHEDGFVRGTRGDECQYEFRVFGVSSLDESIALDVFPSSLTAPPHLATSHIKFFSAQTILLSHRE